MSLDRVVGSLRMAVVEGSGKGLRKRDTGLREIRPPTGGVNLVFHQLRSPRYQQRYSQSHMIEGRKCVHGLGMT